MATTALALPRFQGGREVPALLQRMRSDDLWPSCSPTRLRVRRSCRLASIVPGAKVPALAINRVLYRDGAAIASLIGGEVQWIEQIEPSAARAAAENALIRQPIGSALLAYLR